MTRRPPHRRAARAVALACRLVGAALRIAALTALHAVDYAVRRALLAGAGADAIGRLRGARLAALLERLGPTYIKLGQLLGARPDLVGSAVAAGLARLQDRVRPIPGRVALRALRDGLGRDPAAVFAIVDPRPLACGSIAQVHRATTHDGRDVAIKIRRPGVVRRLAADTALLHAAAAALERLGLAFPLRPWLARFCDAVAGQLDLAREADSYRALRHNLAGIPGVRLPAVIAELSAPGVLTLELLDGLHHIAAPELPIDDRRRALRAGLAALYHMIFVDGLIHADLHPGNVWFRSGGECVLLDAGVVARLEPAVRRDFVEFFLGLVANRGDDCARIICDGALYLAPTADRGAFTADVRAVVARFSALPAREFEVSGFAMALFDLQHRHRIYGAPDFMMAIVALLGYEGIVKQVEPELDFQAIARELLSAARPRA